MIIAPPSFILLMLRERNTVGMQEHTLHIYNPGGRCRSARVGTRITEIRGMKKNHYQAPSLLPEATRSHRMQWGDEGHHRTLATLS